jgi:short subunit dehydrogenase-like uncharacterized protein
MIIVIFTGLRNFNPGNMEPRAFDVVIYGASGFTGRRVALEVARLRSSTPALSFALGGRDTARLNAVREEIAQELGSAAVEGCEMLVANTDARDADGLERLARRARVLLNCVGPFRFHGEAVVQACIAARTQYLDITGEPEFMERVELKYHDAAAAAGVLVVSAAAFDSVPADLGASFAVDTMAAAGATCTAVEEFFSMRSGPAGVAGHFTTFESAVYGIASASALRALRREAARARPEVRVESLGPSLPKPSSLPFWCAREGRYAMVFPGSDASVVRRSQAARAAKRPPIHFGAFFTVPSAWNAALFVAFGGVVQTLAAWSWGRRLLLAFPGVFSNGLFSHRGPTQAQLDATSFSMHFFAQGYSAGALVEARAARAARRPPPPTDVRAVVKVSGAEPGYVATPRLIVALAQLVLSERSLPTGVLTPAAAFGDVPGVYEKLRHAVSFEVVEAPHA